MANQYPHQQEGSAIQSTFGKALTQFLHLNYKHSPLCTRTKEDKKKESKLDEGRATITIYQGDLSWKCNKNEILHSGNEQLNDFVFPSHFMKEICENLRGRFGTKWLNHITLFELFADNTITVREGIKSK